jgi:cyclic pyranopterin phosphate synthase
VSEPVLDVLNRPLRNLRLSVTDRCNLRCEYCMPEEEYAWLPRKDILQFEEISSLVDVFTTLGVDKLRLTGGEPLLRRDLPTLVRLLAAKEEIRDLALTTNGVLLSEHAAALKAAGLKRITVSLDTLRHDRFRRLTRFDSLDAVREGIETAHQVFGSGGSDASAPASLKLDTVVIRGVNDDELTELIEYARSTEAELRFIEYMDVGGATRWSPDRVVSRAEILGVLGRRYGQIHALREDTSAPAERFALPDGTTFGIIASTTEPFCSSCDRSRLTADGLWYLCLYAPMGVDLREPLRAGATPGELVSLITRSWQARADRGAEQRLQLGERRGFVPMQALRKDPHLEMHTRGG